MTESVGTFFLRISWIEKIVAKGYVVVCLNGEESAFFKTGKGLRQGDPLSPHLFNLVSDVLTKMLVKGANLGLVKALGSDFREGGIIALQYADDTLIFSDTEHDHLVNLKGILFWFEQISGMTVNFHKGELIPMNLSDIETHDLSHFFACPVGSFRIRYSGIHLHYDNLRREDIQPLVDKLLKRIADWRGKLLSYAARLVLIKACLACIQYIFCPS
jgi:hypothetical protein